MWNTQNSCRNGEENHSLADFTMGQTTESMPTTREDLNNNFYDHFWILSLFQQFCANSKHLLSSVWDANVHLRFCVEITCQSAQTRYIQKPLVIDDNWLETPEVNPRRRRNTAISSWRSSEEVSGRGGFHTTALLGESVWEPTQNCCVNLRSMKDDGEIRLHIYPIFYNWIFLEFCMTAIFFAPSVWSWWRAKALLLVESLLCSEFFSYALTQGKGWEDTPHTWTLRCVYSENRGMCNFHCIRFQSRVLMFYSCHFCCVASGGGYKQRRGPQDRLGC